MLKWAGREGTMAEIVASLLTSHAPLITGKPEVSRPEQRDRLYGGFRELRRRLAAARPDLIVMFVNDHIQNFPYSNMPAFCIGLAEAYDAPSPGAARLMRIAPRKVRGAPEWGATLLERGLAAGFDFAYSYEIESWDELSVPLHFLLPEGGVPVAPVYPNCAAPSPGGRVRSSPTRRSRSGSPAARRCGCTHDQDLVRPQQGPDGRRPRARDEGAAHRRRSRRS